MLRSNTRVKQPGKELATPDFSLKQEPSDWKVTDVMSSGLMFTRSELGHPERSEECRRVLGRQTEFRVAFRSAPVTKRHAHVERQKVVEGMCD